MALFAFLTVNVCFMPVCPDLINSYLTDVCLPLQPKFIIILTYWRGFDVKVLWPCVPT